MNKIKFDLPRVIHTTRANNFENEILWYIMVQAVYILVKWINN
jgi:hypothetical protein